LKSRVSNHWVIMLPKLKIKLPLFCRIWSLTQRTTRRHIPEDDTLHTLIFFCLHFHPSVMFQIPKMFCLLGYNAMYSGERQLTFWKNMSPPSLVSESKPSKKPA
jgi:hypothetical protein